MGLEMTKRTSTQLLCTYIYSSGLGKNNRVLLFLRGEKDFSYMPYQKGIIFIILSGHKIVKVIIYLFPYFPS